MLVPVMRDIETMGDIVSGNLNQDLYKSITSLLKQYSHSLYKPFLDLFCFNLYVHYFTQLSLQSICTVFSSTSFSQCPLLSANFTLGPINTRD